MRVLYCHSTKQSLTAPTNHSQQQQIAHSINQLFTAPTNSSQQKLINHIIEKLRLVSAVSNLLVLATCRPP